MDSPGNLARVAGFKVNLAVNGKTVKVTDSSIPTYPQFEALVEQVPAIDPGMALGSDIREACVIHTLRDWLPSSMLASSTPAEITATVDSTTFLMTKREDNPSSPFVDFEIVRVL